jgi:hypothetical protein
MKTNKIVSNDPTIRIEVKVISRKVVCGTPAKNGTSSHVKKSSNPKS